MKTKLVRPILLDSEEWQPLALSTSRYGGLFKSEYYTPMTEMGDTYKELILVSLDPDENIEVGDIIYHSLDYYTSLVTDAPQYDNKEMLKEYGYKKVIAIYPQLSPELIQKLINEYNNGGMKDFDIEMCFYYKDLSGEHEAYLVTPTDYYKPKLTNGFITPVTKEEKLYTKSDLKEAFLEAAERFMGMGVGFDEWFEQFKQKKIIKKLILLLLLTSLISCNYQVALVKPYTIVSKRPYVWHDNQVTLYLQEYTYQDSHGTLYYFFEKDIYNIGDTIK